MYSFPLFAIHLQLLEKSIAVAPNDDFTKYLNLGQLLQGQQAVDCFDKGIQLMIQERENLLKKGVSNL